MDYSEEEFLCVVRVDQMSDAEKAKLANAIEAESGTEVDDVRFETIFASGKIAVTDEGNFRFEAYCDCDGKPDGEHVSNAVLQLTKDLGIVSDFSLRFRSFEFSCYGEYDFENGVAAHSHFRRCYDYFEFLEPFMEEQGLKLDDLMGGSFEIRNEEPEVFDAMQNKDIHKWMYWVGNEELNGYFLSMKPRSMDELQAFVALACLTRESFEVMQARISEYVGLKEHDFANDGGVPESLKKTRGLWLYETQKDDAEKLGLACACGDPVVYLSAKIIAASMYLFTYMCVKYDLLKELT